MYPCKMSSHSQLRKISDCWILDKKISISDKYFEQKNSSVFPLLLAMLSKFAVSIVNNTPSGKNPTKITCNWISIEVNSKQAN